MKESKFTFPFQARYYQLGKLNNDTQHLIYVLHGHGQLAKYFLRKFNALDTGQNCIIAPEGLSRYYLEGFSGRVGATWMTSEDRLTDIDNYVNYLNHLHDSISKSLNKNTRVTVIGFSQGAATASRWVAKSKFKIDQFILWAGIFPPDLDIPNEKERFNDLNITYVYGDQDPYINKDRFKEMDAISKKLEVKPDIHKFEGAHVIDEKALKDIFNI